MAVGKKVQTIFACGLVVEIPRVYFEPQTPASCLDDSGLGPIELRLSASVCLMSLAFA